MLQKMKIKIFSYTPICSGQALPSFKETTVFAVDMYAQNCTTNICSITIFFLLFLRLNIRRMLQSFLRQ